MKRPLLIVLIVLTLLSSGCSLVSVGYNNANLFLYYRITGYTSFNSLQKTEIRHEVDKYALWHRNKALPEYISFLHELDTRIREGGLRKTEGVIRTKGEIGELYRKTMAPLVAPTARLLSTLDARQVEELRETLAAKTRKQKEEMLYGSEQKNLVVRAERYIAMVERLTGNLDSTQEKRITELSLRVPFATGLFIEQREAYQAELISLLKNKAGEGKIAAHLSRWISTPEAIRTPQQSKTIQAYEDGMIELTVRIYEMLTERQKNHLRKKIISYAENFQNVTKNAGAETAPR